MRDLIDTLSIITESTGLAGRNTGAVFKNKQGEEIIFDELKFYPELGGKLSADELDTLLDSMSDLKINWLNSKSSRTGGIGIARFINDTDKEFYVGQFFEKINPNLKKNYIPNTIFGYSLETRASKKTKEKLKPQDLLYNKTDLTVSDIISQLENSLGPDNELFKLAKKIGSGHPLPISFPIPDNVTFTGFRDYFCEILQPIAIQKGQYSGNAGEAAEKFLNGSFNNTLITFDESVTAGLSDSVLSTRDGKYVLISTKGGKGAKASAKNLYDKVLQLEETKEGIEFLETYKQEVEIIKDIAKYGMHGSPLYLAVKYNIIDNKEAQQVQSLKNQQPVDLNNLNNIEITANLKKIALNRKTKTPKQTDLYYHLIAAIAEKASEQVNEKTNFSKAAAAILNNGALVQIYTKAKEGKKEWTLNEFQTIYPSTQIKGVYLDSSKTYYSTDIKGNYTFLIDKGEGIPKTKLEPNTPDDIEDFTQTAGKITDEPIYTTQTKREVGNVGRMKR